MPLRHRVRLPLMELEHDWCELHSQKPTYAPEARLRVGQQLLESNLKKPVGRGADGASDLLVVPAPSVGEGRHGREIEADVLVGANVVPVIANDVHKSSLWKQIQECRHKQRMVRILVAQQHRPRLSLRRGIRRIDRGARRGERGRANDVQEALLHPMRVEVPPQQFSLQPQVVTEGTDCPVGPCGSPVPWQQVHDEQGLRRNADSGMHVEYAAQQARARAPAPENEEHAVMRR